MDNNKEFEEFFFNNVFKNLLHLIECGQKKKALSLFKIYYSKVKDSYRKARKDYKKANHPFTKDSCEKGNSELISTALLYAETLYYYSYFLKIAGYNLKAIICLKHVIKLFEMLSLPNSHSKEIYYKAKVDRINYLVDEKQLQKAEYEAQRLLKDSLNFEDNVDSLKNDLIFSIYDVITRVYVCVGKIEEAESITRRLLDKSLKNSEENELAKLSTQLRDNVLPAVVGQVLSNLVGPAAVSTVAAVAGQRIAKKCQDAFEVLSEETLRVLTDKFGVDHPKTLDAMNKAVYEYLVNEKYEEALKWIKILADHGYKNAQYYLGRFYYDGIGVKQKNEDQAFEWLKKSAEGEDGEPMAQVYLGVLYAEGKGVCRDNVEAFKWFKKAAELGESSAQLNLGLMYMNGALVEKNYEEALFWVEKSAEQGDSDAQTVLGNWYYNGTVVGQDYNKAKEWFEKAANQDNAGALYMLGSMYYHGLGVGQNHDKAFEYFEKATKQDYQNCSEAFKKDYIEAKYNLGVMYIYGEGTRKNRKEGLRLIKEAAEQGSANAQRTLGEWHHNGSYVKKDMVKAFDWLKKAAEQGDIEAQYDVFVCYLNGEGVKQNTKEAVKWVKKAAKQGDAKAQYILFDFYLNGEGVKQNTKEAFKWAKKAAEQGDADAQYNVSVFYMNGEGVKQNTKKAVEWAKKAAKQGHELAINALKSLNDDGAGEE